jgi:7-carboxy-7-deazaguanine synthase
MENNEYLFIHEIFYSIQGESTHAGRPCVFVRFTGCNLRCAYCDTAYAYESGQKMSVLEIIDTVESFHCPTVEITGGEPLMQSGVHPLLTELCGNGYRVLLETNGSYAVDTVDPRVIKIVDLKCPSSLMEHHNDYSILNDLTSTDEIKFVITDRNDFNWAVDLLSHNQSLKKVNAILFSPAHRQLEPFQLTEWIKESRIAEPFPNVRLQLAIHKYIWPDQPQGV